MEALQLNPRSRSTFRANIREATAAPHARLDALFEPMFSTHDHGLYGRFLTMNHACLAAIDPMLAASRLAAFVPGLASASRLDALRLDMAELGLQPIAMPTFEEDGRSLPASFGVAYVVEGSRLGSTLLDRRFRDWCEGRPDRDIPGRYLAESAGAGSFAELMRSAAELDWSADALDEAARAARRTFDFFLLAALRTGQAA